MKARNILSVFKFVNLLINARVAYNNVKNDEEAKKTADMFGKRALVYFVVFVVTGCLAAALVVWSVNYLNTIWILVAILGLVMSLYLIVISLAYFILSFNLAIKQKMLNNKACGIIALILNVLVLVSFLICVVAFVVVINK